MMRPVAGPVSPCFVSLGARLGSYGRERRAVLDEERGLNLLVVCAANVCRSPLAEYLLRQGLASLPEFEGHSVSSAGAVASPGAGICGRVEERIGEGGATFAASHHSHALSVDDVRRSGLVLTATKAERAAVARLDPSARSRTFTMREAAALASAGPWDAMGQGEDPLAAFASVIHSRRGLSTPPPKDPSPGLVARLRRQRSSDPLDVPDGHGLSTRQHRQALDEVARAVDGVVTSLRSFAR
jgi:protein-tyrosine phosphatase